MGLDMYFYVKETEFRAYGKLEADLPDMTNYPEELSALGEYIADRNFKSTTISSYYQVGYFRKFNALHNFIVTHYADGVDECQEIYLSKVKVEQLLDVLKQVKVDHRKDSVLLPTARGCFFGSTDYDDYYYENINEAIKMFELILSTVDCDKYHVIYNASW